MVLAAPKRTGSIQTPADPLLRLPFDVWVHCLRFAAYDEAAGPLPFLKVSRHWEHHIIEAPELWTYVEINDSEDLLARIETFLSLSQTQLLDVTIRLPLSDITRTGLKTVLDSSLRLRSIFFDLDDRHLIHSSSSSANYSFSTFYPASHSYYSFGSTPEEMLDVVLRLLNINHRSFPQLTSIAASSEFSTIITPSATSPQILSKSCPKLLCAPLFNIPAEDDECLSPTAQNASFILNHSDDISNILSRDSLRSIAVTNLDNPRQSSQMSGDVAMKTPSTPARSSMLEVVSLITNASATLSSFFNIRHPLLHTLTLELPILFSRSFLSLLPLLPCLKHLSLIFSNCQQIIHHNLLNSPATDYSFGPYLTTPSTAMTASSKNLLAAPFLDSLRITDRRLFSSSHDLSATLEAITGSNILGAAKIIEINASEPLRSDALRNLLQAAPKVEDVDLGRSSWESSRSSEELFPDRTQSGFTTPKTHIQPTLKPTFQFIELNNLRTLKSESLEPLQFLFCPKLEKLICPHLREYNLRSLPFHFGGELKELHIDPRGFEAIDWLVGRRRGGDGMASDRFNSESVWSSLSRLAWSVWAYRPSLPIAYFTSLTSIEFPSRLFVGFDLQTCISPVNYFLAEMLRYPESCPSLRHIVTREYPHWDLLFSVMHQRIRSKNVEDIASLQIPSLPILPVLRTLVALLKGRRSVVPTGLAYQIISERHYNEQSVCCLHCIEAGYITCINTIKGSGQSHPAHPRYPTSTSDATYSLDSAGFNELNELLEYEISDSFVSKVNSPQIDWLEWERRLQDCGRSSAVLAHCNGNGPATCMRHNLNRLTVVDGSTLDGTGEEVDDSGDEDDEYNEIMDDENREDGAGAPRKGSGWYGMDEASLLLFSRIPRFDW